MSPSFLLFLVSNSIILLCLFSLTIHAHRCTENFLSETLSRNLTLCKRYKHRNGVEFGWKIDNTTQTLQVLVGARLESETGWLAWGLNLGPEPRMVGTQALIGIKQTNGSFLGDTYNVTQYIKIGCKLLPSRIDLDAHGILSIIGWGVILPIGVIIARYFKKGPIHWNAHDQWKHAHKACQACGYIFGATGWAVGLWLGNSSKYYSFPKHGAYGISIFTFATLQTLALRLKPRKTDDLHKYWSIYHLSLGYALLVVICVNIFKGIKILQEEETWKPAYIAVIVSLVFVFFVFEIINWLKFKVDQLKRLNEDMSPNGTPHK